MSGVAIEENLRVLASTEIVEDVHYYQDSKLNHAAIAIAPASMPRRQLQIRENRTIVDRVVTSDGPTTKSLVSSTPRSFATSTTKGIRTSTETLSLMTPAPVVHQKLDNNGYYITLTVTNPTTTYTTRVLLGDSSETSFSSLH